MTRRLRREDPAYLAAMREAKAMFDAEMAKSAMKGRGRPKANATPAVAAPVAHDDDVIDLVEDHADEHAEEHEEHGEEAEGHDEEGEEEVVVARPAAKGPAKPAAKAAKVAKKAPPAKSAKPAKVAKAAKPAAKATKAKHAPAKGSGKPAAKKR